MFHNNLWQCPLPVRLIAVGATHVQMWRHLTPERLVSFSSYAVSPADHPRRRLLGDGRDPRGQPLLLEELLPLQRPVPGRAAVHPGLRRRGPGAVVSAQPGPAVHPDPALGLGRDRHPVLHRQRPDPPRDPAPRADRAGCSTCGADHINWAVAPFVLIFGATLPLVLNHDRSGRRRSASNCPSTRPGCSPAHWLSLMVLVFIEDQLAPPRPTEWGIGMRIVSWLQWLCLPVVGVVFTQPAGARRADAAADRPLPGVPGHREGLTRDRWRGLRRRCARSVRQFGAAVRLMDRSGAGHDRRSSVSSFWCVLADLDGAADAVRLERSQTSGPERLLQHGQRRRVLGVGAVERTAARSGRPAAPDGRRSPER